jgi:NAD(P)-dependent dehydrogenase (short-subunit alcohol dehydrogenase family)
VVTRRAREPSSDCAAPRFEPNDVVDGEFELNPSRFALNGRTAFITGSGRGIGRAIAEGYAAAGARVVLTSRTKTEIDEVAAQINGRGGQAHAYVCDVTDRANVEAVAQAVEQDVGAVDILVNNAGGGSPIVPLMELADADWDKTIAKNLKTTMICCQVFGRSMAARESGTIVNISSVMSLGAHPMRSPYAAAKAGVNALTQTLAVELAPNRIRVNAIAPGFIEVERFFKQFPNYATTVRPARLAKVPLGFMGSVEDVADLAIFLASDASRYITGQVIRVDGGLVSTVFYKGDDVMNGWW